MSITATLIDDKYSANDAAGRKTLYFTVSLTNPYTAGGESITVSSYFPNKVLGGNVTMVNPSVSIDAVGGLRNGVVRGDTSSTTTVVLQLLGCGLAGTSKVGLWVDNTVANVSNQTCTLQLIGY